MSSQRGLEYVVYISCKRIKPSSIKEVFYFWTEVSSAYSTALANRCVSVWKHFTIHNIDIKQSKKKKQQKYI